MSPADVHRSQELKASLQDVRRMRLTSPLKTTKDKAATSHLFYFNGIRLILTYVSSQPFRYAGLTSEEQLRITKIVRRRPGSRASMEWTTFLAALAGGGVSIVTAWLTNRAQFKQDQASRVAARMQDQTEHARRKREELHQAVRNEVDAVIQAVTDAQRLTQVAAIRSGTPRDLDFLRNLNSEEIGELAAGYANASASARRLFLTDNDLGYGARRVSEQLDPPEPVYRGSDVIYDLEETIKITRRFLAKETHSD